MNVHTVHYNAVRVFWKETRATKEVEVDCLGAFPFLLVIHARVITDALANPKCQEAVCPPCSFIPIIVVSSRSSRGLFSLSPLCHFSALLGLKSPLRLFLSPPLICCASARS